MTAPHKRAVLYRMVMPEHLCPFGLKSRDLLKREGYSVDDHWLRTREQTDDFKRREGVDTTPQAYIDGQRIGGYDDVRRFFGKPVADPKANQYRQVLAVFGTVGAVSVFKAVYIDKRELKCACVGGDSNVPLGFVSLTENLVMVGMGGWMLLKP